jgi:hypothetical protein
MSEVESPRSQADEHLRDGLSEAPRAHPEICHIKTKRDFQDDAWSLEAALESPWNDKRTLLSRGIAMSGVSENMVIGVAAAVETHALTWRRDDLVPIHAPARHVLHLTPPCPEASSSLADPPARS